MWLRGCEMERSCVVQGRGEYEVHGGEGICVALRVGGGERASVTRRGECIGCVVFSESG